MSDTYDGKGSVGFRVSPWQASPNFCVDLVRSVRGQLSAHGDIPKTRPSGIVEMIREHRRQQHYAQQLTSSVAPVAKRMAHTTTTYNWLIAVGISASIFGSVYFAGQRSLGSKPQPQKVQSISTSNFAPK